MHNYVKIFIISFIYITLFTPTCFSQQDPNEAAISKPTIYYIDSSSGDDTNSGTNPDSPWQTLEAVNNHKFSPGDKILFKAGSRYTGQLRPSGGQERRARVPEPGHPGAGHTGSGQCQGQLQPADRAHLLWPSHRRRRIRVHGGGTGSGGLRCIPRIQRKPSVFPVPQSQHRPGETRGLYRPLPGLDGHGHRDGVGHTLRVGCTRERDLATVELGRAAVRTDPSVLDDVQDVVRPELTAVLTYHDLVEVR